MLQINAVDITVGQDFQRFSRHFFRNQKLSDTFTLRDDMGGEQACKAVHLPEQEFKRAFPVGENQPGERMHPHGNTGQGGGGHA